MPQPRIRLVCLSLPLLYIMTGGGRARAFSFWQTTSFSWRRRLLLPPPTATPLQRLPPLRRTTQHFSTNPSHSEYVSSTSTVDVTTPTTSNTPAYPKVPAKFKPFPFAYHQELNVHIVRLTNRGWGIARVPLDPSLVPPPPYVDDDRGETTATTTNNDSKPWVIMVPGVIPGEEVRVRIFRNFHNYSEADLIEVIKASPDRRIPPCPLANDHCGGCQLQHITLERQRSWKTEMVQEFLASFEVLDGVTVHPTLGTNEELGYRSKLTPHYQQPQKSRHGTQNVDLALSVVDNNTNTTKKVIHAIGFQRKTSRQLVDVEHCPIATPAVNNAYAAVRAKLLADPPQRKKGATLLLRQANLEDDLVETNHKNVLTTHVNGLSFSYLAGNFFQNNYYVLPLMVEHVMKEATSGGKMTHLADCYCGSGLFALSVASKFDCVVGIEINDKAIEEATANARDNHITNCKFLAASAEHIFDVIADFPRETSVVVIDPPRKGCSETFLEQLVAFQPARLVYMSCDPTTQARDAAWLVPRGYHITSVQPFDLFPQTRHIECLMILDRNKESQLLGSSPED